MFKRNIFLKTAMLCLAALLTVLAWSWLFSTTASSQSAQQLNLEQRINRLELQQNQLRRPAPQGPSIQPPPIQDPFPRTRQQSQLTVTDREQMFDRLATLTVELKQQVKQLEARVAKLESTSPNR